jgi:hypothetical protein
MPGDFRVYTSLDETAGRFGPSAITIGNFDGVHAGHQRLLRKVVEIGREQGWKPSVMTFDPHPARVVAPERAPHLLSAPDERDEWMRKSGIEKVLILPFSHAFSQLSAERFVAQGSDGATGRARRRGRRKLPVRADHLGDTRFWFRSESVMATGRSGSRPAHARADGIQQRGAAPD